jgi:SNF family Na+-dependent transporter
MVFSKLIHVFNSTNDISGVGVGMVAVSAMVAIYYNMIIGWSLYYLFASFTSELPWEKCDPEWATESKYPLLTL